MAGAWFRGPNWSIVGTGDYTGDNVDDILWYNSATRDVGAFEQNVGGSGTWLGLGSGGPNWSIEGTGDYTGDNVDDILWYNSVTRDVGAFEQNVGGSGTWLGLGSGGRIGPYSHKSERGGRSRPFRLAKARFECGLWASGLSGEAVGGWLGCPGAGHQLFEREAGQRLTSLVSWLANRLMDRRRSICKFMPPAELCRTGSFSPGFVVTGTWSTRHSSCAPLSTAEDRMMVAEGT